MKNILVVLLLTWTGAAGAAQPAAPKIDKDQATKTALERAPGGKIESMELEDEGGKSVWSFDLRVGKTIREIQVDSETGAIVSDKVETPKQEKDEKAQDALLDKAEKIALVRVKGTVLERHTEKEKGATRCEFLIQAKDGRKLVVEVDSKTNKIVSVKTGEQKKKEEAGEKPD